MDGMPKTGMAKSLEGGPPPLPAPTAIPETVAGKLEEASPPPRVREHFPETLLWKPQLITNDQGEATLDLELADSITTWRLSASAVNSEGHLGSAQLPIKVFQPFFVDLNLPVSLTRNDEVGVPVVVYNYLDGPQTVTLTLKEADWFELDGELKREVTLAAGEVKAFRYRIKVKKVGQQQLEVVAIGMGEARDALRREIAVEPDGRRVETVNSGSLSTPVEMPLVVPDDAIDGSVKAFVKIYPSTFSQLVEGLDNIFRMPSGCFEQTSSTTYPNILALDYLKRTNQSVPEVEAKARQYIHLGYQRLVGFEVDGGGFDWFGRPPANRSLTAYGLMEFEDMARVHDVDPDLIRRTRNWLLRQRDADGSWAPDGGLHEGGARGQDEKMQRLSTTAYIAWAVFSSPDAHRAATATKDFLLNHSASEIHDPYILALMANALLAMDERGADAAPYLERLEQLKKTAADGKHVYWEQPEGSRTTFHGRGRSGSIETTALACLALIEAKAHPASSRAGLTWLITQKDPHGTWHSTQATVLSLKALVAATGSSLGGEKQRRILLRLGEQFEKEIAIAPDQAEVLQLIDLSPHLQPGRQQISLEETTDTGSGYQITFRYHVPGEEMARDGEPLKITMDFDRTDLKVNDVLKISATVVNQTAQPAPMVMLDLPIPAGFVVQADDFQKLVDMKEIARYQVRARQVIVYLRNLQPNRPLNLTYSLQATMPVKIATPGARAYEYYAPDRQGRAPGKNLTVKE